MVPASNLTAQTKINDVPVKSNSGYCSIATNWNHGDGTPDSGGDFQAINVNGKFYVAGGQTGPQTNYGGSQGSEFLESPVMEEKLGFPPLAANQVFKIFIRTYKCPTKTGPIVDQPYNPATNVGYLDSVTITHTVEADYACTSAPVPGTKPGKGKGH